MKRTGVLLAASVLALGAAAAEGALQGLDEMARRAARRGRNAWPGALLERDGDYAWQPETLCYKDVKTGHEVWRMTSTPDLRSYYHNDIAMTPWSADDRRMGLQSWRRSKAWPYRDRVLWMVVNTDGSRMRPTVNSNGYMHWSPLLPDAYYSPGGSRVKGASPGGNILYKVTVTDDGPATRMKRLVTYASGRGCGSRKFISSDGRMYVAMPSVFPGSKGQEYEMFYMPTRIYPDEEAKPLLQKAYSVDRDFGDYLPKPYTKGRYHDAYLLGDGSWYFAIDKQLGYWRIKTLGSAPDGGAKFSPYDPKTGDHGEIIPVDVDKIRQGAKLKAPWDTQSKHRAATEEAFFLGHPGFDRWGELVCYADYGTIDDKGRFYMGCNVYDFVNHKPIRDDWRPLSDGCVHCDWEAWSDWCVVSVYKSQYVPGENRIECFPYDERGKNYVVCMTHNMKGKGKIAPYYNHTRPAQSPDGTKVAWHSDFLNGKDVPDCYWAVCHYPRPPVALKAERSAGSVKLTWKMPSYTRRGWPKKADTPPPAREIRRFHIWRAEAKDGPWQEVGAFAPKYRIDDGRSCIVPEKLEHRVRGDGFYALTSEEWSGLESGGLSEIIEIKRGRAKIVSKAGQKDYWKTPPPELKGLTVRKGGAGGHFELSWAAARSDKVRYCNIYYSTKGAPEPVQANRIASVPAGTATYLDWLADAQAAEAHYSVTAVDRQGNESKAASAAAK